jgi:hypothetical protein
MRLQTTLGMVLFKSYNVPFQAVNLEISKKTITDTLTPFSGLV